MWPGQSVNPFYLPQDVVFDPSILGEWQGADSANKVNRVVIKAKGSDAYLAEFSGYDDDRKAEVIWTFEVHQFAYQQNQFVDFFPLLRALSSGLFYSLFQYDAYRVADILADGFAYFSLDR
jgi:hypothetical protein